VAKSIQVHVSRLRRALGKPGVLATAAGGYQLRVRPGDLDADRFEQTGSRRAPGARGRPSGPR
jgi:hypothetical protein